MPKRRKVLGILGAAAAGGAASGAYHIEGNEETSLEELLHRNSIAFLKQPRKMTDISAAPDDMVQFTDEFEWVQDPVGGVYDVAFPVPKTVKNKYGDCTDYSAVAGSWALKNGMSPTLVLYIPANGGSASHLNVSVGNTIYDFKGIYRNTSPQDYAASQRQQQLALTREF